MRDVLPLLWREVRCSEWARAALQLSHSTSDSHVVPHRSTDKA
jgi:hypothetical protein